MKKRFILLLGVTLVMVLGSATMAYAAANSGYAAWNATSVANTDTAHTPHADYLTTTVKCAVCHAVHKGVDGGQLLLRGDAGGSCVFCHIADNIGLVRIWGGSGTNYTNGGDEAHDNIASGVRVGSRCTDCHSIHGANTMTDASVEKFILKTRASATGAPGGYATAQTAAAAAAVADDKYSQVDAFCSMCHPYFQPSHNGTITVETYRAGGNLQNGNYQSHVMTTATNAFDAAGATYNGKVAWVDSTHCRNCHDAGEVDTQASRAVPSSYTPGSGTAYVVAESWPHYTPSNTRFMVAKSYSTAATEATSLYVPSNSNNSNTMPDGVCLKCHRGTGTTDGVGDDF